MQDLITLINHKYTIAAAVTLVAISLIKRYYNGPSARRQNMNNKIVIVTGASDGIGRITAEELLKSGAKVIYACRNEQKTIQVINQLDKKYRENAIFMKLDLNSFKSVLEFADEINKKFDKLDILVNNAGSVFAKHILTEDQIESTFQVNTYSPMLLTQELLDLLHKSNGRVVNVASKAHTRIPFGHDLVSTVWSKPGWEYYKENYSMYTQYALSKLGNVYFNQHLNQYIVKNKLNVLTVSLHPGVIPTELIRYDYIGNLRYLFMALYPLLWLITKSLNKGAQTTLHCCYAPVSELESGEYYKDCGKTKVHSHADLSQASNRLAFIEFSKAEINKNCQKYSKALNI